MWLFMCQIFINSINRFLRKGVNDDLNEAIVIFSVSP